MENYSKAQIQEKLFHAFEYWIWDQTYMTNESTGLVEYYPWNADRFINKVEKMARGKDLSYGSSPAISIASVRKH